MLSQYVHNKKAYNSFLATMPKMLYIAHLIAPGQI